MAYEIDLPFSAQEIEPSIYVEKCCIYEVPKNLREVNSAAYTPRLISIGPFHHGKPKPMDGEKKRYYHEFFQTRLRTATQPEWGFLKEWLIGEEQVIRHCYSEKFDMSTNQFVDMILLDAVFIIELFLRNLDPWDQENDCMLAKPWLRYGVMQDLILLENQLPIFVLKHFYDKLVVPTKNYPDNFVLLVHEYFKYFDQSIPWKFPESRINSWETYRPLNHFTDFLRCFYIPLKFVAPTAQTSRADDRKSVTKVIRQFEDDLRLTVFEPLKSATKLKEAGVSFKNLPDQPLLDIQFRNPTFHKYCPFLSFLPYLDFVKTHLELPRLQVDDRTECIFRNLIALEECHYPSEAYIMNYVSFMDYLIDTKEDVGLLVENKVISHYLGSNEEVAILFNRLCKQVEASTDYYGAVINDLNKHYDKKWNKTMAKLRSVYFCDLWRGSATVVGIAVLLFTFFSFFSQIF